MVDKRFNLIEGNITFITGNAKNAGKTTFLNYLLPLLRGSFPFAFMTIGIDGETKDQLYGTEKPSIVTEVGDWLITCDEMLNNSSASFEIVNVFPWKTVLGRLLLVKTKRKGSIEIVGPENNSQLEEIITYMQRELAINTILIDGAVNRLSQVSSHGDSLFYYIMSINRENIKSSLESMKFLSLYSKIEKYKKGDFSENIHHYKGALTSKKIMEIPEECKILIIEDFSKIFVTFREMTKLIEKYQIYFEKKMKMAAFVVNLFNVDLKEFKISYNELQIDENIVFNPYEIGEISRV